MKIGEFFLDLFVDAGKGELTVSNLVSSMGKLEVATVGEIAVLFELAQRLAAITDHSIQAAMGFRDYETATGASTDALQAWEAAARQVGISNTTVQSSMEGISGSIQGMLSGVDSNKLANLGRAFGISLKGITADKPEELLRRIRESEQFQSSSNAFKDFWLKSAGLDQMRNVLIKGKGGISDREFLQAVSDAGKISKADAEKYVKMKTDLVAIEDLVTRIGRTITGWFSDDVIAVLNKEIESLRVIADFIDKGAERKAELDQQREVQHKFEVLHPEVKRKRELNDLMQNIPYPVRIPENAIGPIRPTTPSSVNKTINIKPQITNKVNGTKLSKSELLETLNEHSLHVSNMIAGQLNNATT